MRFASARLIGLLALTMMAAVCGGSPASPSATLRAEVSDAAGDISAGGLGVAPDLVHGTATVESGTLRFAIRFAPGTFDRQRTWVFILLDTDQSRATGTPADSFIGADYFLNVSLDISNTQGALRRCLTGSALCPDIVGTPPVTIGNDGIDVTLPLSMLGGGSGRMAFRVSAQLPAQAAADYMPDVSAAPGRIQ